MKRSANPSPVYAKKATTPQDASSPSRLMNHAVKSVLMTLATGLCLLMLFSLFAYFQADPGSLILPLGLLSAALTAFLGGVFIIRLHKHSALVCGLLNGTLVGSLFLVLSLFFAKNASGYSVPISLLIHIGFLLCSVLGSFAGLPRACKKPRKSIRK